MKKKEMIQKVTKELKGLGHKVTKDLVRDTLDAMENVIDEVIEAGDSVTVLGVKFGTKLQKGREGIIQLGSKKGESYKTEDKIVPHVKISGSKKERLSKKA